MGAMPWHHRWHGATGGRSDKEAAKVTPISQSVWWLAKWLGGLRPLRRSGRPPGLVTGGSFLPLPPERSASYRRSAPFHHATIRLILQRIVTPPRFASSRFPSRG